MAERLRLYGYWRSSASYRVRIALNLKGLTCEQVPVHLVRDGGEQHRPAFLRLNPQGLVPVLQHGERIVRQSLAIIEYLDELHPKPPMLPTTARDRARVRALALLVACDVHPLCNLRVMQYLENELGVDAGARQGIRRVRSGQAPPCLRPGALREPEDADGTEHSRGVRAAALRALPDRSELTPCFASSIIRTAYSRRSTPIWTS